MYNGIELIKGPILDRLCEEEPDKTLADIVDIALKREFSFNLSQIQFPINQMKNNDKKFKKRANQNKTTSKYEDNIVSEVNINKKVSNSSCFTVVSQDLFNHDLLHVSIAHINVKFVKK